MRDAFLEWNRQRRNIEELVGDKGAVIKSIKENVDEDTIEKLVGYQGSLAKLSDSTQLKLCFMA